MVEVADMAIDPNDHPHRLQLPQVCCSCLGAKELMHKVSSFYGEEGKSLEAQFDVPLCRACHARMKTRERIAYGIALGLLAVSFILITPLSPVPSTFYKKWLAGPNGLIFAAALLAFLFVAIGRPFEPASFLKGHFRFRNQEFQKKFEELNAVSTPLPKREAR